MSSRSLKYIAFITGLALIPLAQSGWVASAADATSPQPNGTEAAFIADVSQVVKAKFPSVQSAAAAGYYQMTSVEKDGTSLWFDKTWVNVSRYQPNFLWYDKNGKLAGLDYQYPTSSWPNPPGSNAYPVDEGRWTTIDPHMHFGYALPNGTLVRKGVHVLPDVTGEPTAVQLRAAHLLPANATLEWVELHPRAWDLGFWLVPNPNGAFADRNPLVKP